MGPITNANIVGAMYVHLFQGRLNTSHLGTNIYHIYHVGLELLLIIRRRIFVGELFVWDQSSNGPPLEWVDPYGLIWISLKSTSSIKTQVILDKTN